MFQLLLMVIYQISYILYGFIIQPYRSLKTSWWQIDHLSHFNPCSTSQDGIPLVTLGDCWEKRFLVNLICFELPQKLDVRLIQILTLRCWPYFLVLVVRYAMMWSYFYYFILRLSARELEFWWDIHQDVEWNKYTWGQYFMVHHFVSSVAQDMTNLGYCAFPHEWNFELLGL